MTRSPGSEATVTATAPAPGAGNGLGAANAPEWEALARHHAEIAGTHLRTLFAEDPRRGETMTAEALVVDVATALPGDTATLVVVAGGCWALVWNGAAAIRTPAEKVAIFAGVSFISNSPESR